MTLAPAFKIDSFPSAILMLMYINRRWMCLNGYGLGCLWVELLFMMTTALIGAEGLLGWLIAVWGWMGL